MHSSTEYLFAFPFGSFCGFLFYSMMMFNKNKISFPLARILCTRTFSLSFYLLNYCSFFRFTSISIEQSPILFIIFSFLLLSIEQSPLYFSFSHFFVCTILSVVLVPGFLKSFFISVPTQFWLMLITKTSGFCHLSGATHWGVQYNIFMHTFLVSVSITISYFSLWFNIFHHSLSGIFFLLSYTV